MLYEKSLLKCNENIPFDTTFYYDAAEEWAETMDSDTCAFLEATSDEAITRSTSSLRVSFKTYSIPKKSITGGGFYSVGAALVIVGAVIVAVRRTKSSNTIGKDLDNALVSKGGEVA